MNKELSNELKILIKIYEYNVKGERVWSRKLENDFSGVMDKSELSKKLDKLFDLGQIDGSWEKMDGVWTRCFTIAPDCESYVKSIKEKGEMNG